MNKAKLFTVILALSVISCFPAKSFAQNGPIMYFCEKYDNGETGVSDRFTTGTITVMVKCDYALQLTDVNIQLDKYNCSSNKFDYYKDVAFTISPDMKYIYFQSDKLNFDKTGLFRVFLLDQNRNTITSGLIEIIPSN